MPPTKPTQIEVDSMAAFIESAEELQQEPFFGPDEKRIMAYNGNNYSFELGDRFHFRSALVSFRRIWIAKEASNFYKIYNTLSKYDRDNLSFQMWAPSIRETHLQTEAIHINPKSSLDNKTLVDLWLNAVFAHNNIAQKIQQPKRFDRIDFERYSKDLGYAFFEYSFRMAVWQFGLCYINLSNCVARPILASWKVKHTLLPSFQIGAPFGHGTEEISNDGIKITRKASTQYSNPESREQKLSRLLSRSEFQQLGSIFKSIIAPNFLDIIGNADSYEDLLKACGFQIELVVMVDTLKIQQDMAGQTALALIPCHSRRNPDYYSAVYVGKRIVTQQAAIDFFNGRFRDLKKLFMA